MLSEGLPKRRAASGGACGQGQGVTDCIRMGDGVMAARVVDAVAVCVVEMK